MSDTKEMKLQNKIVLVTGSGRGIGAETAKLFAKNGATVILVSRTKPELEKVLKEIISDSPESIAIPCDLSEVGAVEALFAKIREQFGRMDILINNAAIAKLIPFEKITLRDWDETMNLNLRSVFLCCQQAFPLMRGRNSLIINISSLAGIPGTQKFSGLAAYSVSKFGISGLTECLAEEGKNDGLRVVGLAPGGVDTKMLRDLFPDFRTQTGPAEIAKIILDLATNERRFRSGEMIPVDTNL